MSRCKGKKRKKKVSLERYIFEICWQPLFGFLGIQGLINLETIIRSMATTPIPFRSHNVVGNDLGTIHIGVSPLKLHRDRFPSLIQNAVLGSLKSSSNQTMNLILVSIAWMPLHSITLTNYTRYCIQWYMLFYPSFMSIWFSSDTSYE